MNCYVSVIRCGNEVKGERLSLYPLRPLGEVILSLERILQHSLIPIDNLNLITIWFFLCVLICCSFSQHIWMCQRWGYAVLVQRLLHHSNMGNTMVIDLLSIWLQISLRTSWRSHCIYSLKSAFVLALLLQPLLQFGSRVLRICWSWSKSLHGGRVYFV